MGGFKFIGPHYVFENAIKDTICSCKGITEDISEDYEQTLLRKEEKLLSLDDILDVEFLDKLETFHLGNSMKYTVKKRAIHDKRYSEENHTAIPTNMYMKGQYLENEHREIGLRDAQHAKKNEKLLKSLNYNNDYKEIKRISEKPTLPEKKGLFMLSR